MLFIVNSFLVVNKKACHNLRNSYDRHFFDNHLKPISSSKILFNNLEILNYSIYFFVVSAVAAPCFPTWKVSGTLLPEGDTRT
jgi:hypothetical protein